MLRITPHISPAACLLQVEGALCGPWVNELQSEMESSSMPVILNLRGVSFIDAQGTALLERACAHGATIRDASPFVSLMLQKASSQTCDSSLPKEG